MKLLFPYLFLFILLFSCKENDSESQAVEKDKTDITAEKPVIVIHRAKQKITEAGKPNVSKALPPTVYAANANVIPVDELTTVDAATKLKTITPGVDTFPLPKSIAVKPQIILCKQPIPQKSQPPRFKDAAISDIQYLDVDQGMISSMIKSIIVDKSNNIWIGTNGAGVSRYDGREFFHFTEKNGLSNNTVLNLFQDSKGNIWFGTEGGGACCFDGENFISITEDEGLGNNTVLSVYEDKKGNIWFGTNGGGAFKYDGKTLTGYTETEGLSNNNVRCILEDSKGNIWFGTTGSGACMWDGKSFKYFGEDEGLNSTIIHDIHEDKLGHLYFATEDGGVNVYDGKTVEYITKKRGLSSDCIVSLHEDKMGNLWIGTYDSGLCKYNGEEITIYSTEQGLTNNYILSIAEDNSGSLWLATYGGGVCRFNNGSFNHYTKKEGIGSNTVRSIVEDKNGNLCLSTFGDGIIYYNGKSFSHYTDKEGLPSNRYKASVVDSNYVWYGSEENGAVRFDGKIFETFTEAQGLNSDYILSMCKSSDGKIWFGTDEGGVCSYDGKQFVSLVDEEGLSDGIINCIFQDRNNNMWFAAEGEGVCCYDGEFLKWYNRKSGLCGNHITCITEDKDGNIWFGSEGRGVSKLLQKTINSKDPVFKNYSEKNGLSDNSIRSMMQDKSGHIWIATERGLNYLLEKPDGADMHVYTSGDGLKANNFLMNSVCIDNKNVIWWGNGKALTNLNLNNYKIPASVPVMQLNSIELEKTFVDFFALIDTAQAKVKIVVGEKDKKDLRKASFNRVEKFHNYPVNLSLPYNINQIEFLYDAIDWAGLDKIQYEYMLVGADEDWSPLTTDNKASYTNLSNGDFTFRVKAIGISGKWSEVLEYNFTIRPPWYKTIWAYGLYVIAFLAVVGGFNNIRTRQLKVRQQELEKTVEERTAEVVEQKELIEEKQKEILDSINYAKRIQSAMLASDHLFSQNLKNYFVFFEPKDIVSGDFYWASPIPDGKFVLVSADSTGHGVPGAMMSMLNISCLNEAINERKLLSPAAILDHARQRIISSLAQDGSDEGGKDGMDCSVVVFDFKNGSLTFAAANNPVWIVRAGANGAELIELKPDRMPVGKHAKDNVPFTETTVEIKSGDMIYTLTDGMPDQFGGERQKKFTYKRLKDILIEIHYNTSKEQKDYLSKTFYAWRGGLEQVDDVLIIGVKV